MALKEQTMDENISKLISGEAISDEFKPSIGCSIKWKNVGRDKSLPHLR